MAKPCIGEPEREAVDRVLSSGMLAQGPEVAAFESEFSESAVQNRHCIAVNSGTSALHLSLLALGIGPGDEVIVPAFTFAATANAVALVGATPVFADICLEDYCLSPTSVRSRIGPRTRAVMPVHLYGHPASMVQIKALCDEYGLLLIEDSAQAHLAELNGKMIGTWGDAAAFSFYPTKNMTSGEGGMIVTDDERVARSVRLLRNQGQERRYENEVVGLNNRMTDIHAAIGRSQLARLEGWTKTRIANAEFFSANIKGVVVPSVADGARHVFHQYTIRVEGMSRDDFSAELARRGVGNAVYYPIPTHRLPSFRQLEDLPKTDLAALQVLSLPVYPSLQQSELEFIVNAVNAIAKAGA